MVALGEEKCRTEALASMLEQELSGWKRIVILGIGNEFGGDDSLGLLAAQKLRQALSNMPRVEVLTAATAPENFTGKLRRLSPSHVIFIDAAESGERAGIVKLVDPHKIEKQMPSTHGIPLYMLVEYLEHELNCKVIILGIQPKRASFGGSISGEVESSVTQLVFILKQLLGNLSEAEV